MVFFFSPTLIVTFFLASVFSLIIVQFLQFLDLNKRVFNHVPGECSTIQAIDSGAADMAFFDNSILIASGSSLINSTNATNAGIYTYRPESREFFKLEISGLNGRRKLNPHGISVFMNLLMVANTLNPEKTQDRVDIFAVDYSADKNAVPRLRFQKSVSSESMTGIRGIVAIGKDQFYAANRHYFRDTRLRQIETIFSLKSGAILFFDGKKVHVVKENLQNPTGLAFDRRKRQLYVSCFSANAIHVYNANLHNLTKVNASDLKKLFFQGIFQEIQLGSAPYFLLFDPFSSNLLVTAHPLKLRYIFHESHPFNYFSPSQILKITRKKSNWSISQLYANDGATISAATSVLMLYPQKRPNQLLIGNVHNGILACDVTF